MMDLFSDGKDVLYRVKIKYEEENLRTVLLGWVWWGLSRPTTDFERYLATPTRVKNVEQAKVAILKFFGENARRNQQKKKRQVLRGS